MPTRPSSPDPDLFAHQPAPRSDGVLAVTVTHLELVPAGWTRRGVAPAIEIDIVCEPKPTASFYLRLYDRVGRPWLWYERRLYGHDELEAMLSRPGHEVHVARHEGGLVGYFELYENEIVFFGLTPGFIGRRVGPWLLDRAIERAFARGSSRLILNTNTVDHPRALDTYRKAGFRIVRREERELQDPRVLWPDIYRWPPK
ncbi:MAG: GNAT family N-acetyltransferase [Enhydrobacter sp.]|nr:GNAT family N-acetyltransferase [Enhydrobacter sp.]